MRIGKKNPGIEQVIAELKKIGYAPSWGIFSTHEFALPQRRRRVYVWTRGAPAKRVLQGAGPLFVASCVLRLLVQCASAVGFEEMRLQAHGVWTGSSPED